MEKVGAMASNIFNQLRSEKQLCDALITVEGVEFHVHKIILCGCSAYFRALFTNGFYPSDQHMYSIPGVSAHIMELIIEHAYGQQINITKGNVRELLITADALDISDLVNKCCKVLKAQLSLETCVGICCLAHYYSLENLKQQAFQMILFNFEEVVRISDEFLDLKVEHLSEIIENDNLNVKSENVVFDAVLKWTSHSLQERKAQIGLLVPKVRMGRLTRDYFMVKVKNNALLTTDEASRPIIHSVLYNKRLKPDLTRPRLPNAILLAIGGSKNKKTNAIEAYDSQADRWVQVRHNDSIPRYQQGTVFLNGFVYCIGGCDAEDISLNTVSRFNPMSRTWIEVRPMHYHRRFVAVCVLDDQIYAIGGHNGQEYLNTVERYNPETDQWGMIAPMQQQRSQAGAAALNGKVYVCGGFGGCGRGEYLYTAEYYCPQMGQWTSIPSMSSRRSAAGVTVYEGEVYVVGGEDFFFYLRSAEVYNPQTNSWRNIPDMITQRSDFGIEIMDDRLFVVGGFNRFGTIREVEYCDLKNTEWCAVKNTRLSRSSLSCCVLSGLPNMAEYSAPRDDLCRVPKRLHRTKRRR